MPGSNAFAAAAQSALDVMAEDADALRVLGIPRALNDRLAAELLQRFCHTNGSTSRVVATVKTLPIVLDDGPSEWSIEPAVRDALVSSYRDSASEHFVEVSTFVADYYAARAKHDRARSSRELLWRAAAQVLPVDPERGITHLENLVDLAIGPNARADVDSAARLAAAEFPGTEQHAGELAYFKGRRAYAHGDRQYAEREFRRTWERSRRPGMRAIAGHLLANILLDQARDLTEAEQFARESLILHQESRSPYEVAFVEVTLARILLRDERVDVPIEARELLDDALSRLERAGDDRGSVMALVNRARYFSQVRAWGAAREDAHAAVTLSRRLRDERELSNALATLASALIRSGKSHRGAAAQAVSESAKLGEALGDTAHAPVIAYLRSLLAEAEGRIDTAIEHAEEAADLNTELRLWWRAEMMRARVQKLRRERRQHRRSR